MPVPGVLISNAQQSSIRNSQMPISDVVVLLLLWSKWGSMLCGRFERTPINQKEGQKKKGREKSGKHS
jgi:hypothetical protein